MRPKSNLQRKVTPKATMSLRTKRLLHQVQVGLAKPHDDLALPTSGSKDPKWVKEGVGNQSQKDGGRCLARRPPEVDSSSRWRTKAWPRWPHCGGRPLLPLERKESGRTRMQLALWVQRVRLEEQNDLSVRKESGSSWPLRSPRVAVFGSPCLSTKLKGAGMN